MGERMDVETEINFKKVVAATELDLDFHSISPEDVLDQLGLSGLSIDQLLPFLKKAALEIKEAWDTKLYRERPNGMKKFLSLKKKHAPIAYAIYELLRKADKEPRMTVYLISNRAHSVTASPDTVVFWEHEDLIFGLCKSLKKDGYYASA
jgi:hypothetical protein